MNRSLLLVILTIFLLPCGCMKPPSPAKGPVKKSLILMDTLIEIAAYGNRNVADKAVKEAIKEMKRLDAIFDRHKESSFARKFDNNAGFKPLTAPPEFLAVLSASGKLVKASNGSFDPTIAPALDAYSFDAKSPYIPREEELSELLKLRDWSKVLLDEQKGQAALLQKGMAIDLGGVAKGFIVDTGLQKLRQGGVEAALINAGGDLATFGRKWSKDPFRIGIQHPDDPKTITGVLRLTDCAVATSGDYERYVEVDGKRYHHLLHPKTGRPSRKSRSATVVTTSALVADALATSVFILGPKEGIAFAERLPKVEASVVSPQGKTFSTTGFDKWLERGLGNE